MTHPKTEKLDPKNFNSKNCPWTKFGIKCLPGMFCKRIKANGEEEIICTGELNDDSSKVNEVEATLRETIVDCASKTVREAFTKISNGAARSPREFIREGTRTYIEMPKKASLKKSLDSFLFIRHIS